MRLMIGVILGALSCATSAQAQGTFANLSAQGLPIVYVTDRTGHETEGKLLRLTDTTIVVEEPTGARTFSIDQVSLVERKGDSLKNGGIIGAIFGAVTGVALGADCTDCGGTRVAAAVINTGLWAAIGAGIDALIPGRTRIWPSKSSKAQSRVVASFSPRTHSAFVGWRLK
ncbi:MAG: hypothetical protein JF612_11885 [Planctomycetia bacterium]|nr:hypothetical protein [Planctomycetia bacterium]